MDSKALAYKTALEATIAECTAKADAANSSLDVWDRAEIEYLRDIVHRLDTESAQHVYNTLLTELPILEEQVAREEGCYTFDWYDDHYYEKIYSGRLCGCKKAIALYGALQV